jgi:hypothetical protein
MMLVEGVHVPSKVVRDLERIKQGRLYEPPVLRAQRA